MSKVFDSNILIYHLNDSLTPTAEKLIEQAPEENAVISVITRIEVLGWPDQDEEALQRAKTLLNFFDEQSLTDPIIDRCISLRQSRTLKIPDAIIAATVLQLNFPLVTRNTDDFIRFRLYPVPGTAGSRSPGSGSREPGGREPGACGSDGDAEGRGSGRGGQ